MICCFECKSLVCKENTFIPDFYIRDDYEYKGCSKYAKEQLYSRSVCLHCMFRCKYFSYINFTEAKRRVDEKIRLDIQYRKLKEAEEKLRQARYADPVFGDLFRQNDQLQSMCRNFINQVSNLPGI